MDNKKITIRAYNKVWKIENRIYAIYNIRFPLPIKPRSIGYYIAVALILNIIPGYKMMHAVLRYAIPFFIAQFLLKKKLDGKSPIRYFFSLLKYFFTKYQYTERFKAVSGSKKIKINWSCSKGLKGGIT